MDEENFSNATNSLRSFFGINAKQKHMYTLFHTKEIAT